MDGVTDKNFIGHSRLIKSEMDDGFQMIASSSLIFFKFIRNMLYLCAAQLKF